MERDAMIAGVGFREAASPASILDALARAGAGDLRRIAVPEVKARHPAIQTLRRFGYHVTEITAEALTRPATLTDSPAARATHGTGSVAEACALAALGPGARLMAPRAVSADGMATAALAKEESE
ncbi:cobalamin biosynthesis protein [Paenirhodobacter populi]|nr:cobalamin biosynthesis protein [Sinirhodobacter populi]